MEDSVDPEVEKAAQARNYLQDTYILIAEGQIL